VIFDNLVGKKLHPRQLLGVRSAACGLA